MALSFAFDATKGETPDTIKQKRDLVRALMGAQRAPQNVGEGLNALGDGIVAAVLNSRANKAEREGVAGASSLFDSIVSGLTGGAGDFPAAPAPRGVGAAPGSFRAAQEETGAPENWAAIQQGIFAGESGGDYDALFGFSNRPGKQFANTKLTDMTVDQALAFADPSGPYGQWVKGQVGRVATPMGAYQVVGTTLRGAKEGLGLKGSEVMTPELQDRIGQWILGTQGTGAWEGYKGPRQPQPQPVQVASLDPNIGVPPPVQQPAQVPAAAPAQSIVQALQPAQQVAQAQVPPMAGGQAPARSPTIQQLMQAAQNPWLNPGQQAVVKMLLEQEIQKQDPMRQLEIQNVQGQIEDRRLDNTREDQRFGLEQDRFKTESQLNREKFEWEKGKPTDDIREYEFYANSEKQAGRQPLGPLDWEIARRKAGATSIDLGGGPDDSELRGALDKETGKLWNVFQEQGANSSAMMQDMQVLDELIKVAPQGPLQGRLAEAFPGLSSAGEAFQSIVKRVAPSLRAPGSGSTSDIEYDGMLRSLPALRNKPEANALISGIMKAKASINMERSDVVTRYSEGDITAKEARRQMAELNKRSIMTPEMKQLLQGVGGQASDVPLQGDVVDGYRFKGGNPADQSAWEKVD